jgi:hypothetical protein
MKTDANIVRKLRILDDLLHQARSLNDEIRNSGHPKAAKIAEELDEQCVPLAWPSHVAHQHLEYPERWEVGPHPIRRKGALR